jgi:hypothetical protein
MRVVVGRLVVPVLVCCVGVAGAARARSNVKTVWLDELDVRQSECGWNSTQSKRSVGGNQLGIGGRKFQRGIGTHSPGRFPINLAGGTRRFTALVGIDDESGNRGTVEFKVVGDGKVLWKSGVVRGGQPPKKVDVKLVGVKKLELIVTTGGDDYGNDHADWADAKFEVTGKDPVAGNWAPGGEPGDEARSRYKDLENQTRNRGKLQGMAHETFRAQWVVTGSDRDPADLALRRTAALLAHIKTMSGAPDLSAEEAKLGELKRSLAGTGDQEARYALFEKILAVRRKIAFSNPLLDFDKIVFIKKHFWPPSEKQGNHMCDQYFGFMAMRSGGLFVLEDAFGEKPTVRHVLANSVCRNGRFRGRKLDRGGFLSPDLSYDGETILFAYTEVADRPRRYTWTPDNTYHVFGVKVDGSNLTQLTDGKWNEFDPCWMPNGRIVFMSERRGGFGRCHGRPVPTFTLHTMEADGSDLTCISYHETNEWHPSIDNNGMIVYTRWDYVDRGFNQAHHPWITTPDGRDARAIQGNYATNQRHRPHMEMDVRAIPGSHRLVATAAGHHSQAYGSFVIIDPHVEDDDRMAALKRLTPEVRFPEAEQSNRSGQKYATAWPLSEEFYLCVYDLDGETRRGPRNNFGIYLLDAFGNKELLYRDPAISCLSPIPLKPRLRPPVVPHLTAVGKPRSIGSRSGSSKSGSSRSSRARRSAPKARTNVPEFGTVGLINVYESRNRWPDGTSIKALRIIQVLPKTTPLADRPRVGYGKQKNARVVLGTVPVEADGSANFLLPAKKPVYFQALDGDGIAVQSMRSDVYVHPGEQLLCRGCHEPRNGAPAQPRRYGLAFQREPSKIKPEVEGSNPFSYPRLVQPVLDKNCVPCHTKNRKAPDLSRGDWKKSRERWYTSYHNLRKHAFFFDNQVFTTPRTIPGRFGARASRLYKMLSAGHNKLKLSKEDMHRITLWLECNSDFFGSYDNIEAQARGEVVKPTLE